MSSEEVALSTLDSQIGKALPEDLKNSFLKMDVQGYESFVLEGSERVLNKVKGVQLEMSLVPLYEGQALYKEMVAYLNDRGFKLWAVFPGYSKQATGQLFQMDGIFIKQ